MLKQMLKIIALPALFVVELTSVVQAQRSNGESAAWANVMAAQDAAQAAITQEDVSDSEHKLAQHTERVRLFGVAIVQLTEYMTQYQADTTTIQYLRSLYRLGMYQEGAEDRIQARAAYGKCQTHLKYHDPLAQYDGKRIDQLVQERLSALNLSNTPRAPHGGSVMPIEQPATPFGGGFVGIIKPKDTDKDAGTECGADSSMTHNGLPRLTGTRPDSQRDLNNGGRDPLTPNLTPNKMTVYGPVGPFSSPCHPPNPR
jgi:hypothetical protein